LTMLLALPEDLELILLPFSGFRTVAPTVPVMVTAVVYEKMRTAAIFNR